MLATIQSRILVSSLLSRDIKIKIYKTIILPVVLYGCESWSLTLREEHRLRVFVNRVLRRIFGLRREEELHNLYSSPSIITMIKSRWMRWAGHVGQLGAKRNTYRILLGKPEEKRTLGRPRCRWMDNIKMDLR
jgi:hypothetical protein